MRTARPPVTGEGRPLLLLECAVQERRRGAWIASLLLHAGAVAGLATLPQSALRPSPAHSGARGSITLVAPPRELTQTAPNRGRIGREFTIESLMARRPLWVPAMRSPAQPPQPAPAEAAPKPAPKPAPGMPPAPPRLAPQPPEPAPPRTQIAAAQPPLSNPPAAPAASAPQIQPAEKPKLAFETPGLPAPVSQPAGLAPPRIPTPAGTVAEAAGVAARKGGAGMTVGEYDLPGSGGAGGGFQLPGSVPSPPRNSSSLELLSDPHGVDFKPYLLQVLSAVRRNWRAVIPESARLGRKGRVQIQFAIARDGSVPKLVIALPSGTDAFDRAAVAGISASNPFPPLPAAFTGDEVRLQFTFLYNMPN